MKKFPIHFLFAKKRLSNDDVGVGGKEHRISGDTRPGAGFKTGDSVKEKFGGATPERLS